MRKIKVAVLRNEKPKAFPAIEIVSLKLGINTIAAGISYSRLLDKIINYAT